MVKYYKNFEEIRWKFFSVEIDRFDLRESYDVGRYMAYQSLRKNMSEEEKRREDGGKTREVKKGLIVKILCIKDPKISSSYGVSYSLKKTA